MSKTVDNWIKVPKESYKGKETLKELVPYRSKHNEISQYHWDMSVGFAFSLLAKSALLASGDASNYYLDVTGAERFIEGELKKQEHEWNEDVRLEMYQTLAYAFNSMDSLHHVDEDILRDVANSVPLKLAMDFEHGRRRDDKQ